MYKSKTNPTYLVFLLSVVEANQTCYKGDEIYFSAHGEMYSAEVTSDIVDEK